MLLSQEERECWAQYRRDFGQVWRRQYRRGHLLKIYAMYLTAGSITKGAKNAHCSPNKVRMAIELVKTEELALIQAIQVFNGMLAAQGVA